MARNDDDLDRRDALKLIAGGLGLAALGAEAAACAPTVRAASSEPRRSAAPAPDRSEEHTSELQSHSDLVCRLLLEKKNNRSLPLSLQSRRAAQQNGPSP